MASTSRRGASRAASRRRSRTTRAGRGCWRQGFFPAGPDGSLRPAGRQPARGQPRVRRRASRSRSATSPCGSTPTRPSPSAAPRRTVTIDGEPIPSGRAGACQAGSELRIGISPGPGFRLYVGISGGIDVPLLFGSRATYTMGALGGLEGRALAEGDRLPLGDERDGRRLGRAKRFKASARPAYAREWEIEAMRGPQAAPDYLTEDDMETFFSPFVDGRPQLQPDRNPARVAQVRVGAQERRHRRRPPVEHPRQQLPGRRSQHQRRPAGHPRTRRADRGRIRRRRDRRRTRASGRSASCDRSATRIRFREVTVDEAAELDRELDERLTAASLEEI